MTRRRRPDQTNEKQHGQPAGDPVSAGRIQWGVPTGVESAPGGGRVKSSSEPLSSLDALFLYLESPKTPMHMGSVAIFEGPPLKDHEGIMRMRDIRAEIESRLDAVPKLRMRVRFPHFPGAAPVWVDDAGFEIADHIRLVALPPPGTEAELLELSAEVLAGPLDRRHPLWELWFVDGLAQGRVALIEKLHHSLADGLAGVELATVLLDFDQAPTPSRMAAAWHPRRQPREATIVTRESRAPGLAAGRGRVVGTGSSGASAAPGPTDGGADRRAEDVGHSTHRGPPFFDQRSRG